MEAGKAIEKGVLRVMPDACTIVKPLADGGEGTTEALVEGMGGEMVYVDVHGPLEKSVHAGYGYIRESGTAVMEMAAAAGIVLVGQDKRPLDATTYGVGELIRNAVERGCRKFIVGIGGSATNDCGLGMLTALGYEFLNANGEAVGISASSLEQVAFVKSENVLPELKECCFQVACDVVNPLCGKNGATYIYGPQKGVTAEQRETLDCHLRHFAEVTAAFTGNDHRNSVGAGAAGGLGFAFLSYLGAELKPGIELVLNAVDMDMALEGADLVFTGEGRLDMQTAMGKAPVGIAKMAKKYGAKVIALAGSVTEEAGACNENGIDAYFPILQQIVTLEQAMASSTAQKNIVRTVEQIMRLIKAMTES